MEAVVVIMQETPQCKVHPQAEIFLFEHKRKASRFFRDVIGLCEVDHAAISIINNRNEIFFLSFTPSIEYQLMIFNLWQHDTSFKPEFYTNDQGEYWNKLYSNEKQHELIKIKQLNTKLQAGISIPRKIQGGYVIYSFAVKSSNPITWQMLYDKQDKLAKMGQYCLNQLFEAIPLHHMLYQQSVKQSGSHLKLVVNN